jgi:hypothetical protein
MFLRKDTVSIICFFFCIGRNILLHPKDIIRPPIWEAKKVIIAVDSNMQQANMMYVHPCHHPVAIDSKDGANKLLGVNLHKVFRFVSYWCRIDAAGDRS